MSVWSTLQGVGQMVQGTLEQALGDEEEEAKKKADSVEGTPPVTDSTEHSVATGEDDVTALQERLKQIESQNQLINGEYAKLLREKEEEILRLRNGQEGNQPDEEIVRLKKLLEEKEMENKELNLKAESKFSKLKAQAKSKIAALQEELQSLKAEQSISANTSQDSLNLSIQSVDESAMNEIAKLRQELNATEKQLQDRQREVEETKQLLSTQNAANRLINNMLEDSKTEVLKIREESETKKEEMKATICRLQEKERDLQGQVSDLTNNLATSKMTIHEQNTALDNYAVEVNQLQDVLKTQSNTLERESALLQAQLEKEIEEKATLKTQSDTLERESALLQAQLEKEIEEKATLKTKSDTLERESASLQAQLEKEREEKATLTQQLLDLTHKNEEDKRMTRDLSFASSEFQIVSQGDSEEEWKIIRTSESGSGSSEGKECSPPPEILSMRTREDSPLTKTMQVSSINEEMEKLKSSNAELEALLTSRNTEISALKEEIVQLNDQLSLKSHKVSALEDELQQRQWEGADVSWGGFDETDNMEKMKTELQEDIERLTKEVESLQEELKQSNGEVNKTADDLSKAIKENKQQMVLVQELREELTLKKDELLDYSTKIQELSQTVDRLREELNNKTTEVYQLESEKAEIATERERALAEVSEKNKTIKNIEASEKKLLEEKEEISQEEIAKLTEKNDQLCSQIAALQADKNSQVMAEKEKLESVCAEYETKIKSIYEEKNMLIKQLKDENKRVDGELSACRSEVKALEEWKQLEKSEQGNLKEELKRMSTANDTFSSDSAKCREELMAMEREVKKLRKEKEQFAAEVETVREANKVVEKQTKEGKMRGIELEEELKKYKQETTRLKKQFDSAVDLLQQENSQLKSELSSSKNECTHRVKACEALQEQVKTEGKRSMELKDINKGLHQEVSALNDRCLRLERERASLDHRLVELQRAHEQLQITLETSLNDKESLAEENQSSRRNNEMYEKHVLELTNQIALLVREKDTADENVRKLQRDFIVKEREAKSVKEELELLMKNNKDQSQWTTERQLLLDVQSRLRSDIELATNENRVKQQELDRLKETMNELQTQQKTLQDTLINAQGAMTESNKKESSKVTDLERRMADINFTHSLEVSRFKASLEEEQQRRTIAETKLNEFHLQQQQQQHEDQLSIEIEEDNNQNEEGGVKDMSAAIKKWVRRFIKNPNIVLVRLVRATPQTQLFFIGYLILVHIILIVMFIK